MENKNIDNQGSADKSLRVVTNIMAIGLAVACGAIFVGWIAQAVTGPSNVLEDMERVYQRQGEEIEQDTQLLKAKIETWNLQRVAIAKKKLEDHFSGEHELDSGEVERLMRIAEGHAFVEEDVFTAATR